MYVVKGHHHHRPQCVRTSEDLLELPGHDLLLGNVAVLLEGEDDWILRRHKGVVSDALDDVIEPDLGGEGVAVVNDGVVVRTIPAVHYKQTNKQTNKQAHTRIHTPRIHTDIHTYAHTYVHHTYAHTYTLTLHAATSLPEDSAVDLHAALTAVLVARQVPAQRRGRGWHHVGGAGIMWEGPARNLRTCCGRRLSSSGTWAGPCPCRAQSSSP